EAFLPDKYIADSSQKVSIYRRIAQITNDEENADMMKELEDRFGKLPVQVRRLFAISEIKRIAQSLRIKEITSIGDEVSLLFDIDRPIINTEKLIEMAKANKKLRLSPPSQMMINVEGIGQDQQLLTIKNTLHQLA
ncbi:TPA: hypothetical protein ENS27_14015, partial [bacterium]|nr:hypothetical protein [bacterium]